MAAHENLHPVQFHPDSLGVEEETTVPTHALLHPQIIRDERDPKHGGFGSGMNQEGMDKIVPGHGLTLGEGEYARDDDYFAGIARSIKTHGQQQPLMLHKQPSGMYWLGEGNHRLAAARRHGIEELRVKRGRDAPYEIERDRYPNRVVGSG